MVKIKELILELLPDLSQREIPYSNSPNYAMNANLKNEGTNPTENSNTLDSSRTFASRTITLDRFKNTHAFFKR